MSLKLGDLHELQMKEEDIVIVLGNQLDNAIAECEKLLASGSGGTLIFLKLVYVKSVVEQYDGDLVLACDEREFRAVVIL